MSITNDTDEVLLYVYNYFMNSKIRSLPPNINQIFNNLELNNDIQRVIKYLVEQGYIQAYGYIEELNGYSFIEEITADGIDYVEKNLNIPPSELQKRNEERNIILKKLYEYIKVNSRGFVEKKILEELGLDENILWNHLKYLGEKGLVNFEPLSGGNFMVSITSEGIKSVESKMVSSLIKDEENSKLEFKSSLRWDYKSNKPNRAMAEPVLKTLVAFMNTEGGILLIGVDDNKNILGIENDFKDLKDWDHWQQTLVNYINNEIGKEFHEFIRIEKEEVDEKTIAKINVKPSNKPVYLSGNEFYIRAGNTSLKLKDDQIDEYIQNHYKDNSY